MSTMSNFGIEPVGAGGGRPVRIGDAERDDAIARLSEHFAAGRLTRDELDERVEQAMGATYDADLTPLFADLPQPQVAPPRRTAPAPSPAQLLGALVPLLLVGVVVTALVTGTPWLLWSIFWIFMLSGWGGRRAHLVRQHHHRPH